MPYISYIIPVYNLKVSELSTCIDSILNQTYSDNEIIIVDDGSSNGIEAFCDELTTKYGIRVIHQPNQGLASARNTGILAATGEWVVHVDGDDWVERNLSKCLFDDSQNTDADIIVWGYSVYTGNRKRNLLLKNRQIFSKNYESIKEAVLCSVMGSNSQFSFLCLNTAWAKAYKRSFIINENLYFDTSLRRAQDVVYNLYAFDRVTSVHYIDNSLSIYRNDNESLSRGYNPQNIEYITATANAVRQFVDNHSSSPMFDKAYNLFILRCIRMITERTILHIKNKQSIFEKQRVFKSVVNQEPFISALQSGYKRSGFLWYISDYLYEHQMFFSILLLNGIIHYLYKLKHLDR